MKKYFLLPLFLTAFEFAGTDAYADACSNYGLSTGSSCTSGSPKGTGGYTATTSTDCISGGSGCTLKVCNGACSCTKTCTSSPPPTSETCVGSYTWNTSGRPDIQTGTCKTNTGRTASIYRCGDGYGTSAPAGSAEYSFSSPTCNPCPKHPDDSATYSAPNLPSYVTTNGAGVKSLAYCTIKAGIGIKDAKGHSFQFDTPCTYSTAPS